MTSAVTVQPAICASLALRCRWTLARCGSTLRQTKGRGAGVVAPKRPRDAGGKALSRRCASTYEDVRGFWQNPHFRYVDWSGVKPGELVLQHAFRAEGIPLFTMNRRPPRAKASRAAAAPKVTIGLQDAYCIEPRCDCKRVV